jgi:hypothetical protein
LTPNPKKKKKKKRRKTPKQESSKESCHQCNFPQQHTLYNCKPPKNKGHGRKEGKEGMFF